MFAFVTALAVAVVPMVVALRYSKRRPVGTPLSWGEGLAAAGLVFFVLFVSYGVVPHQWLSWSDNELGWRSDRLLLGPGKVFANLLPFELTYQVLRDIIVSGIYGVFLTTQVVMWKVWQGRGTPKAPRRKELDTSPFGRPLVKLSGKG